VGRVLSGKEVTGMRSWEGCIFRQNGAKLV